MELILLMGPPGSGKTTYCQVNPSYQRISQDDMGREGHLDTFFSELSKGTSLIVDRMNFNVAQRKRYLLAAKERGYKTKIVNIKVPYGVCRERIAKRQGHPTINTEADARDALNRFFREYQAPKYYEADVVETLTNP